MDPQLLMSAELLVDLGIKLAAITSSSKTARQSIQDKKEEFGKLLTG